ncbi:sigma-54 dependent transcriptional regulator [Marivirga sp.]|uniref:sigma-54-dependent transcriptional regulator n=1 Tax=Marivirga sp. TaxID=2018662 RepID=UPI002D7F52EE|nr:sigma-54 dependent transcriptional regulator [Marivirga sp.]HET8860748.1 sigma-54 dependent transcriptional regulator [Marivirga sp.]
MDKKSILIVDDSYDMLEVIQRQLSRLHYTTFQASAVQDAIDILENSNVDLLVTDLQMPVTNGMELVKYSAKNYPEIPVLVITGYPSVAGAVEAVKSGALEYLVKPFTVNELKDAVQKALKQPTQLNKKPAEKKKAIANTWGIIGQSEGIQEVMYLISKVNNNKVTTLITGESGTGKELVARAIHYSGKNSKGPFVAVNCGAIPENLLESELFGFSKGSFTGAIDNRQGFFQAADGGTIFLDEIGNASPAVQTRLLRVIQEKEITRIGTNQPIPINTRIIAATNSDLYSMSKAGNFREDLYYRLNVISISIPPLRERKDDIPELTNYFLQKFSKEYDKKNIVLSDTAAKILERHSWPGNIRELENIIQRAIILCDQKIEQQHLPLYIKSHPVTTDENPTVGFLSLKEVEKRHIIKTLEAVDGNKTKAASILGINRKTLREKLKDISGT